MDAFAAEASMSTTQVTSAMLQPSSAPTSSAAHQIRSRITVVCAECKRLKLKCDRKQPCGSCAKRDTVSKCQYTAAAAEKVDIHSLHNRTTQLEAFMTMYTNGRFQSSYPSTNTSSVGVTQAVINAASFSTSQSHDLGPYHQHHHHSAASLIPNDSISTSFHSLASALSEDLELAISATSPRGQGNSLKLEPPNEVNLGALAADPVPRQSSWNRSPLSPRAAHTQPSTEQSIQGGMMLPSMGIYFGPSSPNPSNTFLHPSSSPQQPNIPRVSPNLLACLPSLPTCQRLLHIAGDVFRVRPLQFGPKYGSGNGWKGFEKKCLQLLDDSGKQNDGKGMSAKRAREIYMAGQPQHHLNRMDVEIGGTPDRVRSPGGDTALPSLTFFAMMCATLAIGAASSPNDDDESTTSESPPFFYFIAQQALGVWDTNKFSSTSWVANDCEEMEYIFACLLCIMYLLRSGALTTVVANSRREGQDYEALEDERAKILSSLVGKMVNTARAMHLDKDSTWPKQGKKKEAVRAEQRAQDASDAGTGKAELGEEGEATEEPLIDEWKRMVWREIVFYDLFIADALGQAPYISTNPHVTMLPACTAPPSMESGNTSDGDLHPSSLADPIVMRNVDGSPPRTVLPAVATSPKSNDESYLSARYRLVQITQAIKTRITLPGCCCGYTLDQAVLLENEVRTWLEGLPAVLTVPPVNGSTNAVEASLSRLTCREVAKRLQAFELAMIANILVVSIYSPFLRGTGNGYGRRTAPNMPATFSCTYAAHTTVRLALSLQTLLASCPVFCVLPLMFDFFSLEGLMSDAAVICAHAVFSEKSSSLPFRADELVEDVAVGLKVLSSFTLPVITTAVATADTRKKALEALQEHLDQRQQGGVKRKHHRIGETSFGDDHNKRDSYDDDLPESQIAMDRTMLGTFSGSTPNRVANKEKDKKGAKKSGYPTVGVRIREGKSIIHDSRMPSPSKTTTSKPRTLPPCEAVSKFKQRLQQRPDRSQSGSPPTSSPPGFDKLQTLPIPSDLQVEAGYRSRSSSTNQVPETLKSPLNAGTPLPDTHDGLELPPRKRQNLHDIRDPLALQQQHQQPIPFHSSTLAQHIFDQGHQHTPMYGASLSAQSPLDGIVYGVASTSTFSNASSPFTSTASPRTTPPHFGTTPLVSTDQSTTYFSPQHPYVPTYPDSSLSSSAVTHAHAAMAGFPGIDQAIIPDPGRPVYGQPSQQLEGMENFCQQMVQQEQHGQNHAVGSASFNSDTLPEQIHPMTSGATPWPAHSQTYWEEGGYRFYS